MSYKLSQQTDMDMYRHLVQCVAQPIGAHDVRPGLACNDLIAHLTKLFHISPAHEAHVLRRVCHAIPRDVVLRVTVIEAKGIRAMDDNGLSDPYCMLSMLNMQTSPQSSPEAERKRSSAPLSSDTPSPMLGKKRLSSNSLGSKFRRSFRKSFSGISPSQSNGSVKSLEAFKLWHDKESKDDEPQNDAKECLRTTTKFETLNPVWNEQFTLKVTDLEKEELHLHLWDSDADETLLKNFKNIDKKCGFRNLLKHIKQTVEHGKMIDDFIGYVSIPLKSILAIGSNKWYDICRKYCSKPTREGQISLQLQFETAPYTSRSEECARITYRDYCDAVSRLMELEARDEAQARRDCFKYSGFFSEQSRIALRLYAIQRGVGQLSQVVCRLTVLLQWAVSSKPYSVLPTAICSAIQEIDELFALADKGIIPRSLEEHEIVGLKCAVEDYIKHSFSNLEDLPQLFPEDSQLKAEFGLKIDCVIRLLQQKLWTSAKTESFKEMHVASIRRIASLVTQRIQADVSYWLKSSLAAQPAHGGLLEAGAAGSSNASLISLAGMVAASGSCGGYLVLEQMEVLIGMIDTATAFIQPERQQAYGSIDVNFPKTVVLALDRPLSIKAQELLLTLEDYQKANQKMTTTILETSKVSLRLHMALKAFLKSAKHYFEMRHCFKLNLSKYQTWFNSAVVFWLQSFRNECETRTIKALEIDQDFVPVDSLVKFSNSSVDVLACFVKIIQEWTAIDIKNPDLSLMAAIKITDTICDGARLYCNKIEFILERQGFYSDKQVFDITDQHCITLNNLEHIRVYLSKIPNLLNYDELMRDIALHHDEEGVKDRSEDVLHSLLDGAENDLVMKCETLIKRMVDRISCDLANYMNHFLSSEDSKPSTMDPLLSYLTSNFKTLKDKLMESLFPLVSAELWNCVLHIFDENLLEGAKPEYYHMMSKFFLILKGHFVNVGLHEEDLAFKFPLSLRLRSRLASNSLTSQELIIDCYDMMAKNASDWWLEGGQCVGNLVIKMGYHEDVDGMYTVIVDVIGISYNKNVFENQQHLCSFVTLELCPTCVFHQSGTLKTKTVSDSPRPSFNERFYLEGVSKEAFEQRGSVAAFHLYHYKPFLSDEHIGEAFIELQSAVKIDKLLGDAMDTIKPLCIPIRCAKDLCFAPYEILRRRTSWCKDARLFVSRRTYALKHQRETTAALKATSSTRRADLKASWRLASSPAARGGGSGCDSALDSSPNSSRSCGCSNSSKGSLSRSEHVLADSRLSSRSSGRWTPGCSQCDCDEPDGLLQPARSWQRLSRRWTAMASRVTDSLPASFRVGQLAERRMSSLCTYKSKMRLQRSTSGSSLEITLNSE